MRIDNLITPDLDFFSSHFFCFFFVTKSRGAVYLHFTIIRIWYLNGDFMHNGPINEILN